MKRPSALRALAAFAVAAPLVACGLFLDLQPLQFDEPDAAPLEGGAIDSPGALDAPRDVDLDVDVDAGSRCSDGKKHDFCDDFERITGELQDRWNKRRELSGSGKVEAAIADGAPSPVTVFRSSIDRGADGGQVVHIARLSKQDSPWARTDGGAQPAIRVAFEALFEVVDTTPYEAAFANVTLGGSSIGEDVLVLSVYRDVAELRFRLLEVYGGDGGAQYAGKDLPMTAPLGVWTPIVLEIQERLPGLNGGALVTIGGTTAPYSLASGSRSPYFRADLGLSVGSFAGSRSTVLYDNVRIDFLP